MQEPEVVIPEVLGQDEPMGFRDDSHPSERPTEESTWSSIKGVFTRRSITGTWWNQVKGIVWGALAVDLAAAGTTNLFSRPIAFGIGAMVCGYFCWQNRVPIKRWPWPVVMAGVYCGFKLPFFFMMIPMATICVFFYLVNQRFPRGKKGGPSPNAPKRPK